MAYIKRIITMLGRKIRNEYLRKKIINKSPTIISNNCNATFIYKDLGLKFYSPTINLFFSINDFIKFIENMDYYLSLDLIELTDNTKNYPVGRLGDIQINFMHYSSFQDAKKSGLLDVKG